MPAPFCELAAADGLLLDLLTTCLAPMQVLLPAYEPAGKLTGFTLEYLNPAGQYLVYESGWPAGAGAACFPQPMPEQVLTFYRRVFETGEAGTWLATIPYLGSAYLSARRSGSRLLVSFSTTASFVPTAGEQAWRDSQAHGRVSRAEAEVQRVFELAPVAIVTFRGPDFVVELANAAMGVLWERPPAEVIGRPVFEALPDAAGQGLEEIFAAVHRTGQAQHVLERPVVLRRALTGQPGLGYYNFACKPLRNALGQISGLILVVADVTAQVVARQTSEAAARRLRLLTDALPVLIGYLDREEHFQFVNQAYEVWFQQRPAELLGRSLREVVGDAAYRLVQGHVVRALGGERVDFEATMPYRPDCTRHVRASYVPDVQDGQIVGFYTLVADVSAQVKDQRAVQTTNEALALANQQLTRTNADLDNFIYTASHDLRTPIINLEGLLGALREELPTEASNPAIPQLLDLMQDSVERFQLTINQLSEVAQLQQAHAQPAEALDIETVVAAVRLDMAPLLTQSGTQLTVDVSTCPTGAFSAKNLRSIIYNLLSNAVKYRHPDRLPAVQLRCHAAGPLTVLEVQDNGLGLDAGQQAQLFRMFHRLHSHVEGAGIGLYLVKKVVENSGGTVSVQSQPGVGSTFSVAFPS